MLRLILSRSAQLVRYEQRTPDKAQVQRYRTQTLLRNAQK
jgi:hypothetical protein